MVPSHNLSAVRTIEDVVATNADGEEEVLGTKVGHEVLSTDRDTLFPLQSALGYEITQSLFIGEHTLLVEGPGDILYLKSFSEELKKRNRHSLDPRWTLCPVGGIRKVSAFMNLFGANKLHVAILVDFVHGDKKYIEDLRASTVLRSGRVLTVSDYAEQPEADVEDLLGTGYVDLANKSFALSSHDRVQYPSGPCRILKYVEEAFRLMPATVPEFDHFTPASFLFDKRSAIIKSLSNLDVALSRFERLFTDLNRLIGKDGRPA